MKISTTIIGIIFAILAYFSFSLLDAIQKTAVIYNSVFQILFLKYFFTLFLSTAESIRKKNIYFYQTQNIKLQIIRSFLSIIESGCFVLSFRYLTLADAHSIGSLTPVIVVGLSAIFLREKVSPKTWIAIFVGFIVKRKIVIDELDMNQTLFNFWRFIIRFIAPVAVTLIFINGFV